MKIAWTNDAWDEYLQWQQEDEKIHRYQRPDQGHQTRSE
jgi:Txe/YoeB family toxin of Txe-Axe toxin-antitoxin module